MKLVPKDTGVGTGSGLSLVTTVPLPVGSKIGSNLLTVVNWRMGTEAPLYGVIPTGCSDGPGLL